jgi:hypothetical protein
MYGENARLCVNFGSVKNGAAQTKLSTLPKPSQTIFLGEVDPNCSTDQTPPDTINTSQSNVIGSHCAKTARHNNNQLEDFSMCDGSSTAARTNDFMRTPAEMNAATGATEWGTDRKMYWWASPDTVQ